MEKIKMQPTRLEDALLTDAFANFLEKCRAKNLSEKTLNIYQRALSVASARGKYESPGQPPLPRYGLRRV